MLGWLQPVRGRGRQRPGSGMTRHDKLIDRILRGASDANIAFGGE